MIRNVTVFCSSSSKIDPLHLQTAWDMGDAIARAGWGLVYGGNALGSMGALANGARQAGGKVIGVTPRLFIDKGQADAQADELIISNDMRDRKEILLARGDAVIALPGGLGTFEEIFDAIVSRQLGYHRKPIVLLNTAGYYDPLLAMMDHGMSQHFIRPSARAMYHVEHSIMATIDFLRGTTVEIPSPAGSIGRESSTKE